MIDRQTIRLLKSASQAKAKLRNYLQILNNTSKLLIDPKQ